MTYYETIQNKTISQNDWPHTKPNINAYWNSNKKRDKIPTSETNNIISKNYIHIVFF